MIPCRLISSVRFGTCDILFTDFDFGAAQYKYPNDVHGTFILRYHLFICPLSIFHFLKYFHYLIGSLALLALISNFNRVRLGHAAFIQLFLVISLCLSARIYASISVAICGTPFMCTFGDLIRIATDGYYAK